MLPAETNSGDRSPASENSNQEPSRSANGASGDEGQLRIEHEGASVHSVPGKVEGSDENQAELGVDGSQLIDHMQGYNDDGEQLEDDKDILENRVVEQSEVLADVIEPGLNQGLNQETNFNGSYSINRLETLDESHRMAGANEGEPSSSRSSAVDLHGAPAGQYGSAPPIVESGTLPGSILGPELEKAASNDFSTLPSSEGVGDD